MEIKYNISERLQKELVTSGKEAKKSQFSVVIDTEVPSDIITNSELVTVTEEGLAVLDLTGKILFHTDFKSIYANEGPASNWIYRKVFTAQKSKFYCGAENDELHDFDYEINSSATIRKALNEVESINKEKVREAKERTAEELASFPARINEYNKQKEHKQYIEALERIKELENRNNYLQQKQEEIKKEILEEIIEDGFIIREGESEVRYEIEKVK